MTDDHLRAALEASEEGIVVTDGEWRVLLWNRGAERMFGWSAAEALGQPVAALHMRSVLPEQTERYRAELRAGRSIRMSGLRLRKDGSEVHVDSHVTPMIDAAGNYIGALGTVRDVTSLIASERDLRLSEERFAKAFHTNPDCNLISRLSDGLIIEANEGFEKLMGMPRGEVVGKKTAAELDMWANPEDRKTLVRQLLEQGSVRDVPAVFCTREGEYRSMLISANLIDLAGEPHLLGTARDITELKRSQEALLRSEERFAKAFSANPSYATLSRLEDGRLIAVNHGFERMTGWKAQEVLGRTAMEIGLWVDQAEREELVRRLRRDGEWHGFKVHFRRKDGGIILIEGSCVLVEIGGERQIIGVARDITEVQRAEDALRQSEEKFAKVFHASPEWIVVVRLQDGLILDANEGFARISGYAVEDAVGRTMADLGIWSHPEKRAEFIRHLRAVGSVSDYEWEFHHKGGAIREGLISSVAIDLGEVPCLISLVRDVTDQRRAEREIRNINAALEHRVRERTAELEGTLRELESFSYSISHDLRSPLRAIAGYAKIIEEDHAAQIDAEGHRLLGRIVGGAIRMSELIDDLLDFSRIGRAELRKVPIEMTGMAREVLGEISEAGSGNNLQLRIADLPPVVADRSLLRQVWVNLLSNAIKYSRQRDSALIEVGGAVEGTEAHFFVRDNGVGFDMAYAGKLFHVFHRLHRDPAYEGTGVGLAIVARIVQRHGGRVWAEAEPDRGAAFHFTLPQA